MNIEEIKEVKRDLNKSQTYSNAIIVPLVQNLLVIIVPTILFAIVAAISLSLMGQPVFLESTINSGNILASFIIVVIINGSLLIFRRLEDRTLPIEFKRSNVDIILSTILSFGVVIFLLLNITFSSIFITILLIIVAFSSSIGVFLTYIRFGGDESLIIKAAYHAGRISQEPVILQLKNALVERKTGEMLENTDEIVANRPDSISEQQANKYLTLYNDAVSMYKLALNNINPVKRYMADNYNMSYNRWSEVVAILNQSRVVDTKNWKVLIEDAQHADDLIKVCIAQKYSQ